MKIKQGDMAFHWLRHDVITSGKRIEILNLYGGDEWYAKGSNTYERFLEPSFNPIIFSSRKVQR